jgi:ribonuclease BN (tRNA processing enzyme)
VRIDILGSGDAFGSGGRFHTCLHLTSADGRGMLVDCGASSSVAMAKAGVDPAGLEAILFTHFHGDHFGGLPFFVLHAQFVTKRTAPLLIAGPAGVEERARTAMEAFFPGSWGAQRPFEMRFLEVRPDAPARINGIDVTAFPVVHDERAGPCQGYRFTEGGRVFAFSGDTGWTDTLIPLADGADVFLTECYSYDHRLSSHIDWKTLESRLPALRAKRIVITHMGTGMLAHDGPLPVERAFDGMVLEP